MIAPELEAIDGFRDAGREVGDIGPLGMLLDFLTFGPVVALLVLLALVLLILVPIDWECAFGALDLGALMLPSAAPSE